MHVLIVDDRSDDRARIADVLRESFPHVEFTGITSQQELAAALPLAVKAVITAQATSWTDAIAVRNTMLECHAFAPVIALGESADWQTAVNLIKGGVCDYLPKEELHRLPTLLRHCLDSFSKARHEAQELHDLRVSEERYRHISRLASDYAYIYRVGYDRSFHVEWISDAFMKMTGYATVEDVVAHGGWRALIHPDDLSGVLTYRDRLLAGETVESDYRVLAKNGDVHWVHNLEEQIGGPCDEYLSRVVGTSHEITARKIAEATLREKEARLRLALEAAGMTDWEWRVKDDAMVTGENHLNLNGRQPKTREAFQAMIHPEDEARIRMLGDEVVANGTDFHGEFRIIEPDSKVHWFLSHGHPLKNEAGEVERVIGVTYEVTERKLAEELLREKEERLRLALEAVGMITWEWLPDRNEIYADRHASNDNTRHVNTLQSFLARVHPDDRDRIKEIALQSVRSGQLLAEEYRVPRPDGTVRWYFVMGRAFDSTAHGSSRQPTRMIGVTQDITERMQMRLERLELLEREHSARLQLEAAVQRLTTIQAVTDVAVTTLEFNDLLHAMLERVCGRLKGDVASILLLSEDRQQLVVRAAYGLDNEFVEGSHVAVGIGLLGQIAQFNEPQFVDDLPFTDVRSGLTHLLGQRARSFIGVPLRAGGRVIGVMHVGARAPHVFVNADLGLLSVLAERVASAIERARLHDEVREGRDRLRTLSRRLMDAQETERRRIARELHDETGQALTAVKLNLQSLKRRTSDQIFCERLDDSLSIVEESLNSVRNISHELRPSILDDLGLVAALRWYIDRQAQRAGFTPFIRTSMVEDRLPSEVETSCFRIVQEAITNIIRHAEATRVWVELSQTAYEYRLVVRDDGVGFNVGRAREHAVQGHSLGLLGMQERAQLAGGQFEIKSGKKGGAEITVRFAYAPSKPSRGGARDTSYVTQS